jgi:hypothetical protein
MNMLPDVFENHCSSMFCILFKTEKVSRYDILTPFLWVFVNAILTPGVLPHLEELPEK